MPRESAARTLMKEVNLAINEPGDFKPTPEQEKFVSQMRARGAATGRRLRLLNAKIKEINAYFSQRYRGR